MYFNANRLISVFDQFEGIIIYGAGNYAHMIYPLLVQWGMKEKIISFTQTKKSGADSIDGIPVVSVDKVYCNKIKCVVLIAVSELYLDEIKRTLSEYDYPNVVSLVDYSITYKESDKIFNQMQTYEEYCRHIAGWYTQTHMDYETYSSILNKLVERGRQREKDWNLIVVICGHLSSRILKIVSALKTEKMDIVMLRYAKGVNPWCEESLEKMGIQVKKCEGIEELLYEALQYAPLVYYVDPQWSDCSWVRIMLKNKEFIGKIVLALYDVMNDGHLQIGEEKLRTERYALENADGIVWRWFSKELLEEKGFEFKGKSIQFIDYCNPVGKCVLSNHRNMSEIKLCMGQGYADEYVDDREHDAKYFDHARIGEILAKIGNRQDCILHLYAGNLSERNIRRCEDYQKEYRNFRFFLGTKYDDLLIRMREYDFGCELWTGGEEPPDDVMVGEYSGSNYRNCVRNFFFDFIEAGLPVVTTASSRLWEYLSAYDIVVKMTLDNLDIDYLKQHKEYYREQVMAARKELGIDKHISRLIDFFNEV